MRNDRPSRSGFGARPPRLLVLLLLAGLAPARAGELASAPADPWDQTALGLFKDAHHAFAQRPADDREARFGAAVTLINLQPKTDANLDRAESLLHALVADDPPDDLSVAARYYLARIPHVHRTRPDTARALAAYREIIALGSPHPLAQRAVVLAGLLSLHEPRLGAEERAARHARVAADAASLDAPSARRDLHLILADVALRHDLGDETVLHHLLAADTAGIARAVTRRDTWLRTAEIARRSGRTEIAVLYYRRFLDQFQSDPRRLAVEERLAALLAPPASS